MGCPPAEDFGIPAGSQCRVGKVCRDPLHSAPPPRLIHRWLGGAWGDLRFFSPHPFLPFPPRAFPETLGLRTGSREGLPAWSAMAAALILSRGCGSLLRRSFRTRRWRPAPIRRVSRRKPEAVETGRGGLIMTEWPLGSVSPPFLSLAQQIRRLTQRPCNPWEQGGCRDSPFSASVPRKLRQLGKSPISNSLQSYWGKAVNGMPFAWDRPVQNAA